MKRHETQAMKEANPGRTADGNRTWASCAALVVGAAMLLCAGIGAAVLSLYHLIGMQLPGCGPASPCAEAQASVWGAVPLVAWPVSHAGVAYFAAMTLGWFWIGRHGPTRRYRAVARMGFCVSCVYLLVMATQDLACPYCMVVHAANIGFVACVELLGAGDRSTWTPLPQVLTAGAAVTLILAVVENISTEAVQREAIEQVDESVQDVLSRTSGAANVFRGRYIKGPERARQRIVILTDYQCPDCKRVEEELSLVMRDRDDVSLSVMHFPFCSDCNDVARERNFNPHPNACRAALAAETAGLLGGAEGFWAMHEWLFRKGGQFTGAQLRDEVLSQRLPVEDFMATMSGEDALRIVQDDIRAGMDLGLHFTPMVFINGVEIKGTHVPGIVARAIERIAAGMPPFLTWDEAMDAPAPAEEKLVADWRESPLLQLPDDAIPRVIVESDGEPQFDVVVWGDYLEEGTIAVDEQLRALAIPGGDIRYTFRHYPFDQECNPGLSRTHHPGACYASKLAEAAGAMGGPGSYRAMHQYLMQTQGTFQQASTVDAAIAIGLPAADLVSMLRTPEVDESIRDDIDAGKMLGLRSIPLIVVNGRKLPRWKLDNAPRMDLFLVQGEAFNLRD